MVDPGKSFLYQFLYRLIAATHSDFNDKNGKSTVTFSLKRRKTSFLAVFLNFGHTRGPGDNSFIPEEVLSSLETNIQEDEYSCRHKKANINSLYFCICYLVRSRDQDTNTSLLLICSYPLEVGKSYAVFPSFLSI